MRIPSLSIVSALGLFTACAPPPYDSSAAPVDEQPTIEIIFPDPGLRPYCSTFLMVVNIENLILNDGFYEEELSPVEGEGHWHLVLPNSQVTALGVPYGTVSGEFAAGTYSFTAQLVDNTHVPLTNIPVDVVEIFIDNDDPDCVGASAGSMSYDDTGTSG